MEPSNGLVLDVPPRTVTRALLVIVACLTVASVVAQVAKHELDVAWEGAANLFDANIESNFPTFYSTIALAVVTFVLVWIGATERSERNRPYWFGLAAVFAVAAIDETVRLHELADNRLQALLETTGLLTGPWVLLGLVVATAIALVFRPFVMRLPRAVRRVGLAGALIFVAGSVGVESVENSLSEADGDPGLASALVGTFSEVCEMIGVVLVLEALLLYIALDRRSLSLALRPSAPGGTD